MMSVELLANYCNSLPFKDVLSVLSLVQPDTQQQVLTLVKNVCYTDVAIGLESYLPYLGGVRQLYLSAEKVTDKLFESFPQLEKLTLRAVDGLTSELYRPLSLLRELQILGEDYSVTELALQYLPRLEKLYVRNHILKASDFRCCRALRILIIDGAKITAEVLNYCPSLTLCIINGTLYKLVDGPLELGILKRFKGLREVAIFGIAGK